MGGATGLPAVHDPAIPELSGCASDGRQPERLWVHNDSSNPPLLFAINPQGQVLQRVRVDGADNVDWEDIAHFVWHGQSYLALADTGDNFAWRDGVAVLLMPEPVPGMRELRPARTIRVHYPDGAHDVEALAVDAAAGDILLLTKRRPPARLYRLRLDGPDVQQAEPIATLPDWWPERQTPVETISEWHYRGAVSAMDLSPDGRRLAMLTGTHWMVFDRDGGEPWAQVLQRQPRIARIPRPSDGPDTIYEALCWAADGGLWINGERLPAPLLHLAPGVPSGP
ncbi:hypothetical protein [Solimonas marina]|uniref:Uncharacterized protein n=1 Tax=Solimonas marina TaxID=2714601 RepID=A0A969W891_9GAMM|nr:hypothetical protein [Solimonas marina]NKF22227.1 hypothetical protein [Solimonas marina]